jgi:hypothetical protein
MKWTKKPRNTFEEAAGLMKSETVTNGLSDGGGGVKMRLCYI